MPAIASTSGRLHSAFVRLLFLQAHRDTDEYPDELVKIIMSRICYKRMFMRQMARDVRAKDIQIFYQIVTHQVETLKTVQLFPHRQVPDIRSISIETTEVTQRIRTESARHVDTAEKAE
jgi:hypothetical protein